MHSRIVDRLRCPVCRAAVRLQAFAEESDGRIVREGVLLCDACKVWYPIYDYVPIMLVFPTRFHDRFAREHAAQMASLSGYGMAKGEPERGEKSVQETFTEEWDKLQENPLSFSYTFDELKKLHGDVFLRSIPAKREISSVLNVGIGLAQETVALHEVIGTDADVFGVDLNLAVLQRGKTYKDRPNFHLVIASLFHIPFETKSFDLVYSMGVIHHTYSTHEAFKSIAQFAAPGGYVFIWVYALDDHLIAHGLLGMMRRVNWQAEKVMRPILSNSPKLVRDVVFSAMTVVAHPLVKSRMRHPNWGFRNTDHFLRDWISPKFAHRHSYNEVLEWYEELGIQVVEFQSAKTYKELFGRPIFGVGLVGRTAAATEPAQVAVAS